MILQSLVKYYDRLNNESDVDIPEFGYSQEKISFSLVINEDGDLLQVKDIRIKPEKGKPIPRELTVPKLNAKTSGIMAFFLWDKTEYVLGTGAIDLKSKKTLEEQKARHLLCFMKFKEMVSTYSLLTEEKRLHAVGRFLNKWLPSKAEKLEYWEDMKGTNIVFEYDNDQSLYIHENLNIKTLWEESLEQKIKNPIRGRCLISGDEKNIARIHPLIKNVSDKNAAIISFNKDKTAFNSFGKSQNYNAPVSIAMSFKYTTVLNYLLRKNSPQKIKIGDSSTVFWTEKQSPIESIFGSVLDQKDDGYSEDIHTFLKAAKQGTIPAGIDEDVPFYILGLAPNAARISVRFWHVSTVGNMAKNLGQHFRDLEMVKSHKERDPTFPGMWKILIETAVLHKTENIPPLLAGVLIRSILMGERYPHSLLTLLISRIRADGSVNYIRAAMIKAILNRNNRINKTPNYKEVTVSLDKDSKSQGYLMGRLFAVLEKVQQEAIPGANATIKDRYFGSASATPKIAFPQLMRMSQNHISKIKKEKPGRGINLDKMIGEIVNLFNDFPSHLSLEEQGLFTIGYYHQRQELFTKKENHK